MTVLCGASALSVCLGNFTPGIPAVSLEGTATMPRRLALSLMIAWLALTCSVFAQAQRPEGFPLAEYQGPTTRTGLRPTITSSRPGSMSCCLRRESTITTGMLLLIWRWLARWTGLVPGRLPVFELPGPVVPRIGRPHASRHQRNIPSDRPSDRRQNSDQWNLD